MNNITLVGRLTARPELNTTTNGTSVCGFTVAVKRPYVKDATDFISCTAWKQKADYLAAYGSKGDLVSLVGTLTTRKTEDREGKTRTYYEVVVNDINVLGKVEKVQIKPDQPAPKFEDITEDENLPF